jgi:hypothetical protein
MSAGAVIGAIGGLAGRTAAGNSRDMDALAGAIEKLAKAGQSALGSITGLASSLTGGLLAPLDAVRGLVDTIGNLVGLFNPGVVTQFQIALNDTLAVLGSALLPVMQGITVYIRAFGDALATLLPALQPLFDAIGQYIANYAQGLVPIFQAAAPFIHLFAEAIGFLLEKLSLGVAFIQGVIAELINIVANLFGLENKFKAASSAGFARRQTRVSTVAQFADDAFANSAKNIYAQQGGGKKPEALLEEIRDAMRGGRELMQQIYEVVREGFLMLIRLAPGGKDAADTYERELERQKKLDREIEAARARQAIKKEWK